MNKLKHLYNPITAAPFRNNSTYTEIMPCQSLAPYIKCFWGTKKPVVTIEKDIKAEELIIPDTCMDIIFDVSYSENTINSSFIGINSEAFLAASKEEDKTTSIFAIRFYAWTAILFSDEPMTDVRNNFFDAQQHYSKIKAAMEPFLFDKATLNERVQVAEKILLANINLKRVNHNLESALFHILCKKGNIKTSVLADEVFISSRQLERIFKEYIGLSPKQLSSLVRYQYLWKDVLFSKNFNVVDAIHRYGYTDQSHLLHDFRKYHTVLPSEARHYALSKIN